MTQKASRGTFKCHGRQISDAHSQPRLYSFEKECTINHMSPVEISCRQGEDLDSYICRGRRIVFEKNGNNCTVAFGQLELLPWLSIRLGVEIN
jgi:hypothetical protein